MANVYGDALCAGLQSAVHFGERPLRLPLEERMRRYGVAGANIVIIERGRIVCCSHHGVQHAGRSDAITDGTQFQAASLSKLVTALATLRLASEGYLDLDRDVNDYLFRWKLRDAAGCCRPVTLRQIMNHSAGISIPHYPGYEAGHPIPKLEAILDGVPPASTGPVVVLGSPGTGTCYSEGGMLVQQLVLEEVCGQPFPVLMDELVLTPLSMSQSTFAQPLPSSLHPGAACHHGFRGEPLEPAWRVYPEMAAAGLWTNASDVARALLAVHGASVGSSTSLFSKPIATQMLTPSGFGSSKGDYGLGVWLSGRPKDRRFGHAGANPGFRHLCMLFTEHGSGVVVLTNGARGNHLIDDVFATLSEAADWPAQAYRTCRKKYCRLPNEALERFGGEYQIVSTTSAALSAFRSAQDRIVISRVDGGVMVTSTAMCDEYFLPQSANVFGNVDNWLGLRFEVDASGRVADVVLTLRSKDTARAERVT
jgi:CubicO group peptidase (beta-lactamase class C family)